MEKQENGTRNSIIVITTLVVAFLPILFIFLSNMASLSKWFWLSVYTFIVVPIICCIATRIVNTFQTLKKGMK